MSGHVPQELCLELLDRVERAEEPLLAWGVADVGMPEDELEALAQHVVDDFGGGFSTEALLEAVEQQMLLYFDDLEGKVRSRSAETIRLMSRLRQLLHGRNGDAPHWSSRPTLVRDFRFERRLRRFPRRDQPTAPTKESAGRQLPPIGREALDALMTDRQGDELLLSGFQSRSVTAVLEAAVSPRPRAVMISAGTGAGKTKAFYVPALAHIAGLVSEERWTKIIAVYPRQELLKDQFTEAFQQARLLDPVLERAGRRKLALAAYYGDVPYTSNSQLRNSWRRSGRGHVCPYLRCPICGGELIRPVDARDSLKCACGFEADSQTILLNRKDMAETPPDVVFMTAEMLNRSLGHLQHGHIVGVGAVRPPQLVLLDEIHTYEGTSGAQTALMLRRWARRTQARAATYVGLSATLREPRQFLSQVTGVPTDDVAAVSVHADELESKGAEYLVALRNDAGAGAATLSTTIQTCMLLARCLDNPSAPVSGGVFGSKVFAFTDNLDVTNRFYSDLCDAEGRLIWNKPIRGKESLALLRHPGQDTDPLAALQRHRAGQAWDLPLRLGNDLTPGSYIPIGRVHSKDAGVDTDARVVVATASLEVGYDDPEVGAVVQHGAPRDVAQFLQRKGRAGRPVEMRPWTVVVLSEYGQDRVAYEGWDLLFRPELPPKHLPVRNRYLLRMHAAAALIDWLASELGSELSGYADLWRLLASPPPSGKYREQNRRDQETIARQLGELLDDRRTQGRFSAYLMEALRLTQAEVDELLWYPPRSIMLSAIPSLLRRLQTEWRNENAATGDDSGPPPPLPEHMSQNLFSALELPEVEVRAERRDGKMTIEERMPFDRVMREFCPGNVSRRAATDEQSASHWVPVPEVESEHVQAVDVRSEYAGLADSGSVTVSCSPYTCDSVECTVGSHELALLRPAAVELKRAPHQLSPSSRSFPNWHSSFRLLGEPVEVALPKDGPAGADGLNFYLHAERARVEATRVVTGTDGSALWNGTELRYRTRFVDGGESVALGVRADVDAAQIEYRLPENYADPTDLPGEILRGLRAAWLITRFEEDLDPYANKFKARWLHDAAVAAVALEMAEEDHDSATQAVEAIQEALPAVMVQALDVLFERVDDEELRGSPLRVRDGIAKLLEHDALVADIRELLRWLWKPLDGKEVRGWLRLRLVQTAGLSVLRGAQMSCSDHDPEAVLLDLAGDELWLTEVTPGGAGFLEALLRRVSTDPRGFNRAVRQTLAPSDATQVDQALRAFLVGLAGDRSLQGLVEEFRKADRPAEQEVALERLRAALNELGHLPTHATVAALVSRLLRPGSSPHTDELVRSLIEGRDRLEARLGIEVDNRVWAFIASRDERYDGLGQTSGRTARLDGIQSVLWRRGWEADSAALSAWSPYAAPVPSAPVVLRWRLAQETKVIAAEAPRALEHCLEELATSGVATLTGDPGNAGPLAEVVGKLNARTVDIDVFRSRPRVSSVTRRESRIEVVVELPEVL